MDALVNRGNPTIARQKALQSNPEFIWKKMPRSKLYLRAYLTLFSVGLAGSMYGTTKMARGIKD